MLEHFSAYLQQNVLMYESKCMFTGATLMSKTLMKYERWGLSLTRQATPQHLLLQLPFLSPVYTWTTAEDIDCKETEKLC